VQIKYVAMESDSLVIAVLASQDEYKKKKKLRNVTIKMPLIKALNFLKITKHKWSLWHEISSSKPCSKVKHNFTKSHNLPPTLQYVSSCWVLKIITLFCNTLTLYLLTWRIRWAPNNASKGQMGFNSGLTLRRLMSYIYGAPILDVSRSHTTTQHSR